MEKFIIEVEVMASAVQIGVTTANLQGTVLSALVSVHENDNMCKQALLDDIRDDILFCQADAYDDIGIV